MGSKLTMTKRIMGKSDRVRVHYERKSTGVRVDHEKKSNGVRG